MKKHNNNFIVRWWSINIFDEKSRWIVETRNGQNPRRLNTYRGRNTPVHVGHLSNLSPGQVIYRLFSQNTHGWRHVYCRSAHDFVFDRTGREHDGFFLYMINNVAHAGRNKAWCQSWQPGRKHEGTAAFGDEAGGETDRLGHARGRNRTAIEDRRLTGGSGRRGPSAGYWYYYKYYYYYQNNYFHDLGRR